MQPKQKVLGGRNSVRVAVVQTPPVFLDREKTIDLACRKIAEAASKGAELIAFMESVAATDISLIRGEYETEDQPPEEGMKFEHSQGPTD